MYSSFELLPTHVAKIISTEAGHMGASIRFLNDPFAFFTLSEFLVLFKKFYHQFLAFSFMFLLLTLKTIL